VSILETLVILRGPLKIGRQLSVALVFLCLHAISMIVFRSQATAATYPFLILAPLLALVVCCWRTRTVDSRMRLPWILFGAGLLIWNVGMWLSVWEELFQHISATIAFFSDFVFFLYGVPVLLAISSPAEDQRIPFFVWLDAIQAILTAYLTYLTLFAVIPFTTRIIHPISESRLLLVFNVENVALACAATLRVLAQPKRGEETRFFQILCSFLWTYAVFAGIYNYVTLNTDGHTMIDVLADVPFLFLALIMMLPAAPQSTTPVIPKKPLSLFIDNASPIFYTMALLALGIVIVRSHFYVGITAISVALVVYGVRTIALQSRYMQSQQALQEARDRLEEMSLKDGLTNVANRRCFDQMLELEWQRATHNQQPLSLLLIDIDFFKKLNDRYGHRRGDDCLVTMAATLQTALPGSRDLLARYGGEEFAVILPDTDSPAAKNVAARMQEAIAELELANETEIGRYVTLSIGIATYQFPGAGTTRSLIETSDQALYKAKEKGRNRIELCVMPNFPNTSMVTG
jgi:diguanylate cyclase (GGDEF)-like protein